MATLTQVWSGDPSLTLGKELRNWSCRKLTAVRVTKLGFNEWRYEEDLEIPLVIRRLCVYYQGCLRIKCNVNAMNQEEGRQVILKEFLCEVTWHRVIVICDRNQLASITAFSSNCSHDHRCFNGICIYKTTLNTGLNNSGTR